MKILSGSLVLSLLVLAAGRAALGQSPPPPAATPPAGSGSGPKIQFAAPTYDFGKIGAGEVVRFDFVFTNAGDAVLEISGVHTSCGCTTAGDWPKQVEPGKTGRIPIQFNSGNMSGAVAKNVTVASNDKSQPSAVLQLRGTIWKPIEVTPQFAVLNVSAESASNATAVVRIINNNLEQPLVVSDPVSNNRAFALELRTNQPGREFELIVKTVPPLAAGNVQGQITLKTSAPQTPILTVTALAVVQQLVAVTPAQILLPPGPLANNYTTPISIRNNGAAPLELSEPVVSGGPALKETRGHKPAVAVGRPILHIQQVEPGRLFTVMVTFPSGFEVAPGEQVELSVKSNNPEFRVIKVPVIQSPRPTPAPVPSGTSGSD
jgi:hypothetical protein